MIKEEIETIICAADSDIRLSISDFDRDVWFGLQMRHGTAHVVLTRKEAQQVIEALQKVLDAEVVE